MTNQQDMPTGGFIERANARIARMKQAAKDLAQELGLPPGAEYDLLAGMYGSALPLEVSALVEVVARAESGGSALPPGAFDETAEGLLIWLAGSSIRERRRYLEAHPELLSQESEALLTAVVASWGGAPKAMAQVREILGLLREVRARGGTITAIRELFVDAYGVFALDLPAWLEEIERSQEEVSQNQSPDLVAKARIDLLREALARAQAELLAPEVVAGLQGELAKAFAASPQVDDWRDTGVVMDACYSALRVYNIEHYPRSYARVQDALGTLYRLRIAGEWQENLEGAIACYHEALRVATVDTLPSLYAQVQCNLGMAYANRIAGERQENLEQALACYREALRVDTPEISPDDYARVHFHLGAVYAHRLKGERRENLEQAIFCYQEALRVWTPAAFPLAYATTQLNLGLVYQERIAGEHRENLEQAITCYREALRTHPPDDVPSFYARVQGTLGHAYRERLAGVRQENLEQALACFDDALRLSTLDAFPYEHAWLQQNRGMVFVERLRGEQKENLERAITCFQVALRIWTQEDFPYEYAETQAGLGTAFASRIVGERLSNLERAIASFQAALEVWTLEACPEEYRGVQLSRAESEAARGDWAAAHEAYTAVLEAEDHLALLGLSGGEQQERFEQGYDVALRDSFALVRQGRIAEAAIVLERGRERAVTRSLAIDGADPDRISDAALRARYLAAREAFVAAQAALRTAALSSGGSSEERRALAQQMDEYRRARSALDRLIAEVHAAGAPADFFNASLDAASLLRIAEGIGPRHALVYLLVTPWGGMALAAGGQLPGSPYAALDLPHLTGELVGQLIEMRLGGDASHVVGGFQSALKGQALAFLQQWPGETLREQFEALQAACRDAGQESTLAEAVQALLSAEDASLAHLTESPLVTLNEYQRAMLAATLDHLLLQRELSRCLTVLGEAALRPLVTWVAEQGVSSLTLIPGGALAAFPLAAATVSGGQTAGDVLPISIAPSARSLLREERTVLPREGVYALGNPSPTSRGLSWGEAEASMLAAVGQSHGLEAEARVQYEASRAWLLDALRKGLVVDASCHGRFDEQDLLRSSFSLANDEQLLLGEMLSHQADVRGLRLLILSPCETALLDPEGTRDEVLSFSEGILTGGAAAVLSALWAVDDEATALLMVRFAQEWFPRMDSEPPAAALTRAQRWLRTVSQREMLAWSASFLQAPAQIPAPELSLAGSARRVAVRGRGDRFEVKQAERAQPVNRANTHLTGDSQPYADPYYWAGFQINGW